MTQSNVTALQTALNYLADSRDGYLKAAETVDRQVFKSAFNARAQERSVMVAKLENAIRTRGGTVDDAGTTIGAIHRSLMSVAALVQDDAKAAIETIDDGEERLREKIRDIIKNGDLEISDRTMLMGVERELEADARMIERIEEMVD